MCYVFAFFWNDCHRTIFFNHPKVTATRKYRPVLPAKFESKREPLLSEFYSRLLVPLAEHPPPHAVIQGPEGEKGLIEDLQLQ